MTDPKSVSLAAARSQARPYPGEVTPPGGVSPPTPQSHPRAFDREGPFVDFLDFRGGLVAFRARPSETRTVGRGAGEGKRP